MMVFNYKKNYINSHAKSCLHFLNIHHSCVVTFPITSNVENDRILSFVHILYNSVSFLHLPDEYKKHSFLLYSLSLFLEIIF